jgi:replicative DNA helicase
LPATPTGIALLSCLRRLGSSTALAEVPEEYFTEPEERAALQWLRDHVRAHRQFPTVRTFNRATGIAAVITREPLSFYLDKARQRAIHREITTKFEAIKQTLIDRNADRYLEINAEIAAFAERFRPERHQQTFAGALDQVMTEFQEAKWSANLRGIDTGYRFLNDATGGWQNTDNIALVGRIGDGKVVSGIEACSRSVGIRSQRTFSIK